MDLDGYEATIEPVRRLQVHPQTVKRLCTQDDLVAQESRAAWVIRREMLAASSDIYDHLPSEARRAEE